MKAILIDDERFSLEYLAEICLEIPGLEVVSSFVNASEALLFLQENEIDLVFADIEMPGLTGLEAVREIRRFRPDTGVIFVTGYENYALEAFQLEAVSYLLKPCDAASLARAVKKAEKLLPAPKKRVEVRTFGRFCVMVDGEPIRFANNKAKELLALLIDGRGAVVSMERAADVLWGERPYDDMVKQLYRKAVAYLHQISRERSLDFFVSNRGSCHILPERIECDYFRLWTGVPEAVALYAGEYMTDYSWAEPTVAKIEHYLSTRQLYSQ